MKTSSNVMAKQRLRAQVRREQALAEAVLAAESRLAAETGKMDAAIAVHETAVAGRRRALAEAIAIYLAEGGVSIARASAVFDRPAHEITRLLREYRRRDVSAAAEIAPSTGMPEGEAR